MDFDLRSQRNFWDPQSGFAPINLSSHRCGKESLLFVRELMDDDVREHTGVSLFRLLKYTSLAIDSTRN